MLPWQRQRVLSTVHAAMLPWRLPTELQPRTVTVHLGHAPHGPARVQPLIGIGETLPVHPNGTHSDGRVGCGRREGQSVPVVAGVLAGKPRAPGPAPMAAPRWHLAAVVPGRESAHIREMRRAAPRPSRQHLCIWLRQSNSSAAEVGLLAQGQAVPDRRCCDPLLVSLAVSRVRGHRVSDFHQCDSACRRWPNAV